ncbi:hypothetical protein LP422_03270 [Janibacter limosus]|uniref:hypothetical protein n=1 Tax=Janibacter limosus TaxID=53458 RepID=UPI0035D87030|nr:hypothetical protein LP422_03270 [Janibacter limosus]
MNSLGSKGVPVSVGFDELDVEGDADEDFAFVDDADVEVLFDVVVGACVEVLPVPAVGPGPPSPARGEGQNRRGGKRHRDPAHGVPSSPEADQAGSVS